ncbi:hypothetical protein MKW94_011952 [Papaver nudicaule]|uniref:1-phosphatidylinositol-4-phosphate 5-kinase n=1 Tax=Papaver nudicaule TaxID=74823 RepID=A0AA41SIM2_PAPNU|nr:hypothetical protein [Papaver nudicaule]
METPIREFSDQDFKASKRICIRFPKNGSKRFPAANITEFGWKDYCPAVFRHIQGLDNIESANYVLSVCGIETLVELSSLGKSGKLLYLSHDDRFVVKTIRKTEKKALLAMLPKYVDHIQTFGSTLLAKFYGLHVVRPVGGAKIYFVVMGNILQTDLYLHRRFDLKGSSQGRSMNKVTIDEATTFKDHDLNLTFFLNPLTRHRLFTQIKKDCRFLEEAGIMGYSLLLGIHIEAPIRGSTNGRSLTSGNSFPPDSSWRQGSTELILDDTIGFFALRIKSAKLLFQASNCARAVPKNEVGSTAQSFNNVRLFFGIIDMLQGYNVVKRLEHAYKALQFDSRKITSVNPKVYSSRFQEYLNTVFEADEMKFRGSFN